MKKKNLTSSQRNQLGKPDLILAKVLSIRTLISQVRYVSGALTRDVSGQVQPHYVVLLGKAIQEPEQPRA